MPSPSKSSSLSPRHRSIPLASATSESASSAPRVSSPLTNSAATARGGDSVQALSPTTTTSSPDSDDEEQFFEEEPSGRARGQAPSSMKSHRDRSKQRRGRDSSPSITVEALGGEGGSSGTSEAGGSTHSLNSFFGGSETTLKGGGGDRGRLLLSPNKPKTRDPSPAPSATTLDASWWGEHEKKDSVLPWKEDRPKRKVSIPAEQLQGMEHTKQRVAIAARSVLGTAHDVAYEILSNGVEFLELAPVPGLAPAAKLLLSIWDAVQNVDVNFYGCLRLTERCADILISIRQEIHEAGDRVGIELAAPIAKLEETFRDVLLFMQKQVRRPFLKRYLKRDEIQSDLKACSEGLRDALSLFSIQIQIRTLRQVQDTARRQREEMQEMINAMIAGGLISANALQSDSSLLLGPHHEEPASIGKASSSSSSSALKRTKSSETVTRFITTRNALGLVDEAHQEALTPANILSILSTLQQDQNSIDSTRDFTEIRNLMRKAIQAPNDAEMLQVLQVKDDQMPEAIKTLQRALEKVQAQGGVVQEDLPPGLVIGKVKRSVSVKEGVGKQKGLKRSRTTISIESASSATSSASLTGSASGGSSGSGGSSRKRDTLDQEFIETGISALMRMSRGRETNLPSWTITKFEVNREKQIGVGGFSKVYRGTWNGRTVAIKVLKMKVTKKLFVREVEIWKKLHHRNIVELYGASSATDPPWFFVSPYMKNGNLVDYLRKVEVQLQKATAEQAARPGSRSPAGSAKSDQHRTSTVPLPGFKAKPDLPLPNREATLPLPVKPTADGGFEVRKEWDLFRFMLEIAEGMVYLHSMGVLHGDLKASNVLVDDNYTCVISDFGQSEIKSEAYRMSGEPVPHKGTMRWQAPEILTGEVEMTKETDVYAFAISLVEIVNYGKLPWGIMLEDEAIRQRVLKDNARPKLNDSPFNTPSLQEILRLCWHRDPVHRPQFSKIVRDLERLQKNFGKGYESPKAAVQQLVEDHASPGSPSPDMKPFPLPPMSPPAPTIDILQWDAGDSQPHLEETVATADIKMPEPVTWKSNVPHKKRTDVPDSSDDAEDFDVLDLDDDAESMAPKDEKILEMKNELRYRLLLNHQFHPSLILPLWTPSSDVALGGVGFLDKPSGRFITLFNAFKPVRSNNSKIQVLPSIDGYGKVTAGSHKQEKLNIIQRGMDQVVGWITSKSKNDDGSTPIRRRHTFDLRAGHKAAHLCTESTEYLYLDKLDAPKKWFTRNIDTIMRVYGKEYNLQREDINLVVGLLRTPNYGLFVSHSHPDGHAHFNVYASPKQGQPWGTFTTDNVASREGGPSYDETNDSRTRVEASKVSTHGGSWDTVLIARLRFKPDAAEPTAK